MSTFDSLAPGAIKRISNERRIVDGERTRLEQEDEIFFYWDETTINRNYLQLLVGAEDTPYEGGFFFFEGKFPDQYPLQPMTMTAMTQGMGFRQHPNYYKEGKCCLSILNTWTGPPWSPTLNIIKVALTMKSLYSKNPLNNEPGYTSCSSNHPTCKAYEIMVEYWTLQVAVIDMLNKPPPGFDVFLPTCKRLFLKYYDRYMRRINNLRTHQVNESKPVYNCYLSPNKNSLLEQYETMYNKLSKA